MRCCPPWRDGRRFQDSLAAFASVFRNANLRWLELAWTASSSDSGPTSSPSPCTRTGSAARKRSGSCSLLASSRPRSFRRSPGCSPIATRESGPAPDERRRASSSSGAAVGVFGTRPWVVYGLSIVRRSPRRRFGPSQAALTPSSHEHRASSQRPTRSPAASRASRSSLARPSQGCCCASRARASSSRRPRCSSHVGVFVILIDVEREEQPRRELAASTIASERSRVHDPRTRTVAAGHDDLFTAQTTSSGALQVFIVVMAIELLDLGDGGVGYLNAAIGVGASSAPSAALSLTGAKRLSPAFIVGLVLTGLPLVAVGSGRNSRSPSLPLPSSASGTPRRRRRVHVIQRTVPTTCSHVCSA